MTGFCRMLQSHVQKLLNSGQVSKTKGIRIYLGESNGQLLHFRGAFYLAKNIYTNAAQNDGSGTG